MTAAPATKPPPVPDPSARRWTVLEPVAYLAALVSLVVPRLYSGSALWLDEALSVNIAALPVPDLLEALRQDGSPPLYYLLLHGWISVFGTGDTAVRSPSSLFSVAALPLGYLVGRRLVPDRAHRTGAAVVLVLAASPFAIRYATETRMYALVMLLALGGVLAAQRALARPTLPRLGVVAALTGLLLLTHYWTLFFVAAAELLFLLRARREHWRGPSARLALALPAGGILFLPWLPSFLFQARHTGTPWRPPPTWADALHTYRWDGTGPIAWTLAALTLVLALSALRTSVGRQLLAVGFGGLLLGLVVFRIQGSAYALRYSAPVLVPVLLAVGVGLTTLSTKARQGACVALVALALGVSALSPMLGPRTQARETASVLNAGTAAGDVVVYCPDQLGPAVSRLLTTGVRQVVYPTMAPPERINWVDYAARNAAASPSDFAARLDADTAGTIWLLRADDYLTFGDQCAELDSHLTALRNSRVVRQDKGALRDAGELIEFSAGGES